MPDANPLTAKTRYRQNDADCILSGISDTGFVLNFAKAQWAVTPGQSAVLYNGDVCLGGGIIENTHSDQNESD
jgi:tRNA-uridine 2-sulfurtransferase